MVEYINKQSAAKFIDDCLLREEKLQSVEKETLLAVKRWIDDISPADVRPVVLCKECRHSRKPDRSSLVEFAVYEGVLICTAGFEHVYPTLSSDIFVLEESFCSVGERGDAE